MTDLISRQAAIDATEIFIKDCNPDHFVGHPNFIEYMDSVGIQSFGRWQYANGFNMGLTAAEVVIKKLPSAQPELDEWCTDCKEYDQERHCCPRWNRVIRETLKDAGLERKKGRWQITDAYPHNVYCPECHVKFAQTNWAVWEDGSLPRNYCPNCGADMRGE